ncbi:DUF3187 family protein [Steroidobacter sp. S1-65]|uniref:DUF3187 family protein n=1 Tax=Steroidobacter gossypii TaxID=2805490 RepID=A0ABS1WWI9_9GAMM|nr:DUF3187 family protein [Steroidobacter gossypii]MBM0105351.1 DUF3187 family protein [Steroidobacter gossypii]
MKKLPAAMLCALAGVACGMPAHAEDGQLYGLLRSRDLTPFGFLRLDMRPAHAVSIKPGSFAIETEVAYQNTWALSPEVEDYLTALEGSGRRDLGPAELQAIRDLPGENYLIDLELALLDVTFHYKISNIWTAYLIASGVSYQGGFLDSTIEGFHDTFGFSSFGRPAVTRNQTNLIYDLKSTQYASLGAPTDGGLLDPTIGLRYTGWTLPGKWHMATEVAVKVPIAGRRELLSTGRTDYGVQVSLQRKGQHHAFYVDAAAVYYDGASQVSPTDAQIIPTLIVGYERMLTSRTNVNLQGYISPSVYSREETDLDELLGQKYQLSLGLRHRRNNFLVTFGITENLQNINNTPDIGFQLGLAWVPLSSMPAR